MRRIYLYNHKIIENKIFITGETAHYLKNVLRMNTGSRFLAFDGTGIEYELEIKKIFSTVVESEIINRKLTQQKETKISLELCISLCKSKTFENIVKKTSEIGISKIIPFYSTRSVVQIENKEDEKLKRWKRIAAEGSKIAGRTKITEIFLPQRFNTLIEDKISGILFWEQSRKNLKNLISNLFQQISESSVLRIFIGPEGGFTDEEIELAEKNKIVVASLGPRILSVETATICACAILMYEIENLDIY